MSKRSQLTGGKKKRTLEKIWECKCTIDVCLAVASGKTEKYPRQCTWRRPWWCGTELCKYKAEFEEFIK